MIEKAQETIEQKDKRTRIAYIIEAGFEHFISLFVTGALLEYLLSTLGFSDGLKGILSTVAAFACSAQFFTFFLVGRRKKKLVTIGHLIYQLCFTCLYLMPIFPIDPSLKPVILVVLLISGHIIHNAINPTKIAWLMTSVPNSTRGRFTSLKEMISLAGGIILSLSMGQIAETFKDESGNPTETYYIICVSALIVMTVIHTLSMIFSNEKDGDSRKKVSVKEALGRIVKNKNLVKVIIVGIVWNIANHIANSFYASYLRGELGFDLVIISYISMGASLCRIAVSPLLGKIADKYSFATSMTLSFSLVAVGYVAVVFTAPATRWVYLVYAALHAFAMAGINSGVINLIYDYVTPDDRAVAMATKNAISGIFAFFTALISGIILDNIQQAGGVNLFGLNLYAQQFLSIFAALATVILIIYMRVVIVPMKKIEPKE